MSLPKSSSASDRGLLAEALSTNESRKPTLFFRLRPFGCFEVSEPDFSCPSMWMVPGKMVFLCCCTAAQIFCSSGSSPLEKSTWHAYLRACMQGRGYHKWRRIQAHILE